jgi:iron complex outermembrane recepter protein
MRGAVVSAASTIALSSVLAQASPCPVLVRDSARVWAPPLDRVVTLHASGSSLRTALDLVAARAGVRLSYASDALPLDREACVPGGPMALGAALTALLHDLPFTPTPSGGRQVVLAARRAAAVAMAPRVANLDRVVVTGSGSGAAQRSLPYALDVVDVRAMRGAAAPTVAQLLNGAIPGLWIWGDAPTTLLTRYGSTRGASSFGVSSPKVFVDGIELANPLLLSRLTADAVDRIEVIRGPQGAALYGADAISGVINVQLRHDGAQSAAGDVTLRSSAGATQSDYASTRGAPVQEHTVSVRVGSAERSAHLIGALNTTGAIVPGGNTTQLSLDAGARRVLSRTIVSGTARGWFATASTPGNPLLNELTGSLPGGTPLERSSEQQVSQYTVGGSIIHAPDDEWTHTLTAGVDGYRLRGLASDLVPVPSSLDSALLSTQGGADKASLRATSVRRLPMVNGTSVTLTLGADAALLRDGTTSTLPAPTTLVRGTSPQLITSSDETRWLSTAGASVNTLLNLHDAVFLSAGLRSERNDGFTEASRLVMLPSLGASAVRTVGVLTAKARLAYGAGVRPARNPMREATWRGYGNGAIARDLQPERQDGIEGGVDLFWGRALSMHVTRFDQHASSLIQQVPIAINRSSGSNPQGWSGNQPRYSYVLTNLGAITNRGWELALQQRFRNVSVAGTMSLVDSRVARVATGYAGELRAGDRVLAVPARTLGLTGTWTPGVWALQLSATSAQDWMNYDRLAIAQTYLNGGNPAWELTGSALRSYWVRYGDVTRVRASLARDVGRFFTVRLLGDNLLDRQRGEPDNITIVPGRSVSLGLSGRF